MSQFDLGGLMEHYPDPPRGWVKLRARMNRAKTAKEINQILEEMTRVLQKYEAKLSSDARFRSQTCPPRDLKSRNLKRP
jgi:hypothetical protein